MDIATYKAEIAREGGKNSRGSGPGPLEKEIQDSILQYLGYKRGVLAWRNNTGAAMLKNKSGKDRFIRFSRPGASDIFAVYEGRFYAIEVKRPGKKLSPDQEFFFEEVRKAGGVPILATCIEDVEKFI